MLLDSDNSGLRQIRSSTERQLRACRPSVSDCRENGLRFLRVCAQVNSGGRNVALSVKRGSLPPAVGAESGLQAPFAPSSFIL